MYVKIKKFLGLTILFAVLATASPSASAQFQSDNNGPNPGPGLFEPAACDAGRDWGTFISSTISYDGALEYWKDILVRYNTNICHYLDIDNLFNRINAVRKQIRQAFYACADTTQLKKTYYALEAELFFLRNYIDTDNQQFTVVSPAKVQRELREFFVLNKGFLSDAEINVLYQSFVDKYTPRLEAYRNCKDPSWDALVVKWNQVKESMGGIAPAVQQAKQSFEGRWNRVNSTPWHQGDKFFGDFLDTRINGLTPAQGLQQIAETLQQNSPTGAYTFEELQVAQQNADSQYNYAVLEQQYMAQYQLKYSESSDALTAQVVDRLTMLDGVIKGTFPYQNQTIQCTKHLNNKQC